MLQSFEIEIATLSSNLRSGAEYNTLPDSDLINNQRMGRCIIAIMNIVEMMHYPFEWFIVR